MTALKNINIVLLMALVIPMFLFTAGCNKHSSRAPGGVQINLSDMSECKDNYLGKSTLETPSDQDCIEYEFTGDGILRLQHINAGFNCCPEIEPEIEVEGNMITINEVETQAQCECLCLFDLDFDVSGITPGVYFISVIEPYLADGDQRLEFEANLTDNPSGTYCVYRDHYPWNMPE